MMYKHVYLPYLHIIYHSIALRKFSVLYSCTGIELLLAETDPVWKKIIIHSKDAALPYGNN